MDTCIGTDVGSGVVAVVGANVGAIFGIGKRMFFQPETLRWPLPFRPTAITVPSTFRPTA